MRNKSFNFFDFFNYTNIFSIILLLPFYMEYCLYVINIFCIFLLNYLSRLQFAIVGTESILVLLLYRYIIIISRKLCDFSIHGPYCYLWQVMSETILFVIQRRLSIYNIHIILLLLLFKTIKTEKHRWWKSKINGNLHRLIFK